MAGRKQGGAAAQVFPQFPYERRFTREEINDDILPRAARLGDAMRDGVAPSGHTLYIPGDIFEMWMVHAALAGCDVDESLAYIRARRLPDQAGRLQDAVQWVLKKDDTDEARAADVDAEADQILAAMSEQLRPEVRDAVRRKLKAQAQAAAEYLADEPGGAERRDQPRDFGAPRLLQYRDEEPQQ